MRNVAAWLDSRASFILSVGIAAVNLAAEFGAPLSAGQQGAISVLLAAVVSFLIGRDARRAGSG